MFIDEMPAAENGFAVDRRALTRRLIEGLAWLYAELDKRGFTSNPHLAANDLPFDEENWELERLNPSTCNLRFSHLIEDGKPTGQASLAQRTIPGAA